VANTIFDVQKQYELFPYPEVPVFAGLQKISMVHASFEAGASLVFQQFISHENKKIGLFGCGTFEPHAFASSHPKAQVTAIDLSHNTIKKAKTRCRLFLNKNIEFKTCDILDFAANNPQTFDYIHSFGVLHHLANPCEGFKALSQSLKPNGFARIMVYSKSSRVRISQAQKLAKLFNLSPHKTNSPEIFKHLIKGLPLTHPFRLTYEFNQDHETKSGIVDAFLHAQENPLTLTQLLKILDDSNLTLQAWDFSQNALDLITDSKADTLIKKLEFLEAFHQWPGPWTFWVSKRSQIQKSKEVYLKLNPLFRAKKTLHSTLLKRDVILAPQHFKIVDKLKGSSQLQSALLLNADQKLKNALDELKNARFLLEVSL
jgi:2-polyprenyl-3-methyl-5-hydroxy-6-metoxy-1,4-benzoquinol methylase